MIIETKLSTQSQIRERERPRTITAACQHVYSLSKATSSLFLSEIIAKYFRFGNFRDNFIFAKCVRRHICHVKNKRLGHDLPSSVNE